VEDVDGHPTAVGNSNGRLRQPVAAGGAETERRQRPEGWLERRRHPEAVMA
jgi:hypothetical protein